MFGQPLSTASTDFDAGVGDSSSFERPGGEGLGLTTSQFGELGSSSSRAESGTSRSWRDAIEEDTNNDISTS